MVHPERDQRSHWYFAHLALPIIAQPSLMQKKKESGGLSRVNSKLCFVHVTCTTMEPSFHLSLLLLFPWRLWCIAIFYCIQICDLQWLSKRELEGFSSYGAGHLPWAYARRTSYLDVQVSLEEWMYFFFQIDEVLNSSFLGVAYNLKQRQSFSFLWL